FVCSTRDAVSLVQTLEQHRPVSFPSRNVRVPLCYLIAGWSGLFVMAVELLGGRLLAPTFGSSIYVWGAIITTFMLPLSLGYLAGGRWSTRAPSVRRLGMILIAAALSVTPILIGAEALL